MVQIKQNILLAPLTTFGIGGNAKFFVEVNGIEDLTEAVRFAKDNKLAVFVLGGGSNILVSDDGFNGLVIKMNMRGLWITDLRCRLSTGVVLTARAGEMWDDIVANAVGKELWGIENLSLIPGTVGGAVYQNIGAYGTEIKDVIKSVKAYNVVTGDIVQLSNSECGFGYRSSIFKKNKKIIILETEILLLGNSTPNIFYPDLAARFSGKSPGIGEVRNAVIEIRKGKLPYPTEVGNAGSFFKNPVIKISNFKFLISKCPDLKGKNIGNNLVKLSAAQLIEKAGWKGKQLGNVGVSGKHALVLVNYGNGTAKELANLEATVREAVEAKFAVELAPEVEKIGGIAK